MHLMHNHERSVKCIHSMLDEIFVLKENFFYFVCSRNARFQADYGFLYMSRIVIVSNGITVEEETEKVIVGYSFIIRLFEMHIHHVFLVINLFKIYFDFIS